MCNIILLENEWLKIKKRKMNFPKWKRKSDLELSNIRLQINSKRISMKINISE